MEGGKNYVLIYVLTFPHHPIVLPSLLTDQLEDIVGHYEKMRESSYLISWKHGDR